MKKVMLIAVLLLVLGVANAYATPVTFNIDELYDWGRLYSYSAGVYTPINTNPAPYGTNPVPGYTIAENTSGVADGAEDSWGIGNIASIKTFPGNATIFERGASEMTLMFFGFDDNFISQPIGASSILHAVGGRIQVYLDATPDFDGSLGTAGRTGLSTYSNVTDGLLVLDLVPVLTAEGATLTSFSNLATGSGAGSMLLGVSGAGAWDAYFDTNTQLYGSDFSLTFTARDNTQGTTIGDWIVRGDAGGESDVIPEPASMVLLGIGLFGAARFRRKV